MAAAVSMRCASCRKTIKVQNESVIALRDTWHKDCFRCSICKVPLIQVFFSRKKKLYCKQHYLAKYSYSCHKCHKKITGLVMEAGDVSFHPECFRCIKCCAFIGHGDDYVFEERSLLFCCRCHEKDVASYNGFKQFKQFQRSAIHQVQITPKQVKDKIFSVILKDKQNKKTGSLSEGKRKATRVVSIISKDTDESSSLKTGDTLLEINGIPVSSSNINQFSDLLEASDQNRRISFTVERNPDDERPAIENTETMKPNILSADPEKYEKYKRNVSFFNFSLEDRSINETSPVKKKSYRNKQLSEDYDRLPETDKLKLLRFVSQPQEAVIPKLPVLAKTKSLNDIVECLTVDEERMYLKNDIRKAVSPLQRAQTLKPDAFRSKLLSQVFRPADLVYGEVIGKGAFGDVIKITHKSTKKDMVMKKLHLVDAEAEEQFLKEVQVLKSLHHPNVLQFIGVMYKDKTLHIIVEYIGGGTLRGLLKSKDIELSWKQKIELSKDIAAGVAYLHSQNVMHRDLKSKNVLIENYEGGLNAIVADFGLASVMQESTQEVLIEPTKPVTPTSTRRRLSTNARHNFKKRHTQVGSPYWMAPEMLNGKPYNETADVFSFGIVLCEIIGRVKADPDELPRTMEFGLDVEKFKLKFGESCPEHFFLLATTCSDMNPENRPPFICCEMWLQSILANLEFGIPLPDKKDTNFCEEPEPIRLNSISAKQKTDFNAT